jgi:hypothetical protein
MFVRKKVGRKPEHSYYQLVTTYREGGKVRQRVLWHLGRDATAAEHLKTLEDRVAAFGKRYPDTPAYHIAKEKLDRFRAILRGEEPPPERGWQYWLRYTDRA